MTSSILAFRPTRPLPPTPSPRPSAHAEATVPDAMPIPAHAFWRRLPDGAVGTTERAALAELLVASHPLGLPHWRAAVTGDAAAAVACALWLCGVDVLDSTRQDLVMSAVLGHAINGDEGARRLLVLTLKRRSLVDGAATTLARSWERSDHVAVPRATALALLEALS